jgi:hypothetical protein
MIRLKSTAILFAVVAALASPSASAWYASRTQVNVTDMNNQQQSGWQYSYALQNNTTCFGRCSDTVLGYSIPEYMLAVREFSIPFFSDAGIIDIAAPTGWAYQILNEDRFNLGFGAGTLTWTATTDQSGIAMNANRSGFSYTALFAPGKGPFSAGFGDGELFIGDPAIPLSPNAVAAGIGAPSSVPEPGTIALILAGFAGLALRRTARKAK